MALSLSFLQPVKNVVGEQPTTSPNDSHMQQVATWSRPPAKLTGPLQCDSGDEGAAQPGRMELLWQDVFADPTQWWDRRQDKTSPRHPDFRHKRSKEVLWLNSKYKPAWVDSRLAILDVQLGTQMASTSASGRPSLPGSDALSLSLENWSTLLEDGKLDETVRGLELLVERGSHIDNSFFYRLLKRCIAHKDLALGSRVHALLVKCGYESNAFLANHVICMYASHGRLAEAGQVFYKLSQPSNQMWASIIFAHARHGQPKQAIKLYGLMRRVKGKADNRIFVAVLKACIAAVDLASGKEVHDDILNGEEEPDEYVLSCLVDMYAKCGSLQDARRVFDGMSSRTVVTWNVMMNGYVRQGFSKKALALYANMEQQGISLVEQATFVCLLKACGSERALQQGKQLHARIQKLGLEADVLVGSCLVDMFAKCGSLEEARRIFDRLPSKNVVTWTAMINGYVQEGLGQEALAVYARMGDDGVTSANQFTFACLLKACGSVGDLVQGKLIHAQIKDRGFEPGLVVGNCLINMYAKCGSVGDALQVFNEMPTRDVLTWTSMINGYVQQGLGLEALALHTRMQQEGMTPADHFTFTCLLKACATVGALQQGKQLHAQIKESCHEGHVVVSNCLVDMYAKCGSLVDAREVFDRMPKRDVVTWNVMINGYGQCNDGSQAVTCFQEMQQQGVQPNKATFICLLVACSREGLVAEGEQYFEKMEQEHGITPELDHYHCMVDLLGRSGRLDEAEKILQTLPSERAIVGWTSLLSACKSHGDIERAGRCFGRVIAVEPENAAAYVMLGSMYANCGRWGEVERLENMRKSAGAKKKPAKATIEVRDKVHEFTVGEKRNDISSKLTSVNLRLKEEGHTPRTELVLRAVSEKEKEDALCGHAEKLALAYGLLNTPEGTPLLVTKNLLMCSDCHSSTKVLSRVEKREITVRDAHSVHRFVQGSCSCGDRH